MGLIILLGILYLALCLLAAMPAYKKARGIYFISVLVCVALTPLFGFVLVYLFINSGCRNTYDNDF